jgi:serpin B
LLAQGETVPLEAGPQQSMACVADAAAGMTKAGLPLFALLCEQEPARPATLLSPLSISSALALALAGATPGDSLERELEEMLGSAHGLVAETTHALLAAGTGGGGVSLQVANSVWAKGSIKPAFVELVREVHRAEASPLPATYAPINDWVAERTGGRIGEVLLGAPDPLVVALLVNAVLFKGTWATQFDPQQTRLGHFYPASDAPPLPASFMFRKAKMAAAASVAELGGAAAVRLDYGQENGPFCALLVLPPSPGADALAQMVKQLSAAGLQSVLESLTFQETSVALPRFRVETEPLSLVPALRRLGLNRMFDGPGGFSGMSDDPAVHVSDVLHKVVVEVNEEGTVAAAATAAVMLTRSMPIPHLAIRFDRPFLMAVLHAPTGIPLFLARLSRPDFA